MANSSESESVNNNNGTESSFNVSSNMKTVDVHPLAFTIEFNDQKVDEVRKSRVHERLSGVSLKHRRNPSLPDFADVKNSKSSPPMEKPPVVPVICKGKQKSERKPMENQWKSSVLNAVKNSDELKSPLILRNLEVKNLARENIAGHLKNARRNSLNDMDGTKMTSQHETLSKVEFKVVFLDSAEKNSNPENKSDTVSEAGTYTVDKEDGSTEDDLDKTRVVENEEEREIGNKEADAKFQSSWINDWVRDVEQQSMLNPAMKDRPPVINKNTESRHSSPGASKIPSPINTLSKKVKLRGSIKSGEVFPTKLNGTAKHRRSSSLSSRDRNDHQDNRNSLETESYLRTTESVVTAMQTRMRMSLDGRSTNLKNVEVRNFGYKEKPHPPSTASDTDTNSDTDGKAFKKPIGNPFTSARLNRAFSLRRAKADPANDLGKKKSPASNNNNKETDLKRSTGNIGPSPSPKTVSVNPSASSPFSRTDCGRFSMRSTMSSIRSSLSGQIQKKDSKKSNGNNRSASSLSSREVEFQNWRRRKSFDPMKSAAEGRKKELAKKAAMNQSVMTQSANLGNGTRSRGGNVNPVLRSASFHSTAQAFGDGVEDREEFQDQGSTDDQEDSAASSWTSNHHHSLLYNSPNQICSRCHAISRGLVCSSGSRCSLASETLSSPSRRLRSSDLDTLVMTAINDLSHKLKSKSCNLLKKLMYLYDLNDEKTYRLKDEIAVLESRRNSAKNSPIHQAASQDLSAILKNLKGLENVLKVLDDVLFDENLEIYVNEY